MNKLQIDYEILTYDRLKNRLKNIVTNPNNKFPVIDNGILGYSASGFPINHYSIGHGFIHVLYVGGCHGNEIISVDFVTQLMNNLALGNNIFADFNPEIYTIDFIPCQNPDGYYTTTYAINSITKNMDDSQLEQFCRNYWKAYREDDIVAVKFNKLIKAFCIQNNVDEKQTSFLFWKKFNGVKSNITQDDLENFFSSLKLNLEDIHDITWKLWHEYFQNNEQVSILKKHQLIFKDVSFDAILEIDENHKTLKNKLKKLYTEQVFPLSTLANFYANSNGVNLNDNNPYYYHELKDRIGLEGEVYSSLRENNLLKSIPGPIGTPNYDMNKPFRYESENEALLNYFARQEAKGLNFASFNCHGTGGYMYVYPVWENDLEQAHNGKITRSFKFLINSILATEYTRKIGEVYKKENKSIAKVKDLGYKTMGHPDRITGVGDVLRKTYNAAFLLELSKMGGNPIAPYGDRLGNFNLTMQANMEACMHILKIIKNIDYLYNSSYDMQYDNYGNVFYRIRKR